MIRENHYKSLKRHVRNLLYGLSIHQEGLLEGIDPKISEAYYAKALQKLQNQKQLVDQRKEEYHQAVVRFNQEYEGLRKYWKRDIQKLKKSVSDPEVLETFGLYFVK